MLLISLSLPNVVPMVFLLMFFSLELIFLKRKGLVSRGSHWSRSLVSVFPSKGWGMAYLKGHNKKYLLRFWGLCLAINKLAADQEDENGPRRFQASNKYPLGFWGSSSTICFCWPFFWKSCVTVVVSIGGWEGFFHLLDVFTHFKLYVQGRMKNDQFLVFYFHNACVNFP